jgi:hypothetical protein
MELFHYTCEHGRAALGDVGVVVPMRKHAPESAERLPADWGWMADLVWFTDQWPPDRIDLGLTMAVTPCDRTQHRYRATDASSLVPWHVGWLELPRNAWMLTQGDRRPGRWWLGWDPVPVAYDPPKGA